MVESRPASSARLVGKLIDEEDDDVTCCEHPRVVDNNGQKVCMTCGTVHGVMIVEFQKRAYTVEEKRNRQNSEVMAPGSFGTVMTTTGIKHVSASRLFAIKRLAKIDNTMGKNNHRALTTYHNEMKRVMAKYEIPTHVQQTTWSIMSVVANRKLARGHSIRTITAAIIYRACHLHGIAIFRDEFLDEGVTPKNLHAALKVVDPVIKEKYSIRRMPITRYIYRMGEITGVQHEGTMHALMLASKIASKDRSVFLGKSPATIVAGLFYISCKITRSRIGGDLATQTAIANKCHVTEVSVRNMAKRIMKVLGISLKD